MDLSLIGPYRREVSSLGRLWLTIADMVGFAVGLTIAIVAIVVLVD